MLTVKGTLATVAVASTTNLAAAYVNGALGDGATLTATAFGALVIDTVTLAVGQRVLVAGQTDATENGVFEVTVAGDSLTYWVLTRTDDFDNSVAGQVKEGVFLFVQSGATNASTSWIQTTVGTGVGGAIIIGTDAITFVEASSVLYHFIPGTDVFVVKADTFGVGIATVVSVSMTHTTADFTGATLSYTVDYANAGRANATVSSSLVFATLDAALAYYATVVT